MPNPALLEREEFDDSITLGDGAAVLGNEPKPGTAIRESSSSSSTRCGNANTGDRHRLTVKSGRLPAETGVQTGPG